MANFFDPFGVSNIFKNGPNPADRANEYIRQIPGQTAPYFDPYIQAGGRAIPNLEEQYNSLLTNPSERLSRIGEGFQQSPGFRFALDQALGASGRAAAAGGMAGSPQHEQQNMQLANNLANQDYYNFLDRALGLYGQGLHGEQGLYSGGLNASTNMADMIAQALAQQGANEYQGQAGQNQNRSQLLGSALGLGARAFGSGFI